MVVVNMNPCVHSVLDIILSKAMYIHAKIPVKLWKGLNSYGCLKTLLENKENTCYLLEGWTAKKQLLGYWI